MAQKTIVELIDDIDGGQADETVRFGLDGYNYEIDLSKKNAAGMRNALAKYADAGRRVGGTRGRRARATSVRSSSQAIRAWAKANGVTVTDRGRIPASVVAQFNEAMRP